MCQLSLTHFFPTKICEGRWGWRSWRKRCSDCSIPPRMSTASWETWMGNTEKYWWVFTVGPVTTPPGHSQLSTFHPPVFAVFQVQRFLRMFWKKKISKNLGHQDHTQTEEMGSPQFLRWGGIFSGCILKGAFWGSKDGRWYVICIKLGGQTHGRRRFNGTGGMIEKLRVLDTRKVRLLPN